MPLLGFTYEELAEFARQKKLASQAATKPQEFNLQQLVVTGEVQGDHADLVAEYKIQLDDSDSVEVPLLNGGAVLREPAAYKGGGEHWLRYNAATGSYSVRLRGAARSEHQLTLKFIVPVKASAAPRRWK